MKIQDNDLMLLDMTDVTQEDWEELEKELNRLKIRYKWIESWEGKK